MAALAISCTGERASAQGHARHAEQVTLTLDTCTRVFEAATQSAYDAIRKHTGATNDAIAARLFTEAAGYPISESTLYRLKAGSNWRTPAKKLCAAIDEYTASFGPTYDLTKKHAAFTAAHQAVDDLKNARR